MANEFILGLELSTRASHALSHHQVQNLNDLMALTKEVILNTKHCGRKTWNEISDLQNHFRRIVSGEDDLLRLLALLGNVNHLRRKHPYFHIVVTGTGSLQAIDTRPKEQDNG